MGICRPCHSQIHALLTEKELEREWNTVERLLRHPEIQRFAGWIASKPRGFKCANRTAAIKGMRRSTPGPAHLLDFDAKQD